MGNVSSYSYNVYGEITESIDANGNKATYSYDKTGKCIRLTYPDGTAVDTAYDPAGRPVSISTGVTDIITGEKRTVSVSYTYRRKDYNLG